MSTIGNIGSMKLAEDLSPLIVSHVFSDVQSHPIYVKKRACLVLLSFLKRKKSLFNEKSWPAGLYQLLASKNFGLLLAGCSLLQGVINLHGAEVFGEYAESLVLRLIYKMNQMKADGKDYYYYMTPCPWLQIMILRILQCFPPPYDVGDREQINQVLSSIVNDTEVTKNVNKNNCDHAILFEAFHLIIHYDHMVKEEMRVNVVTLLGRFIQVKEPNIRYLALETMAKVKDLTYPGKENLLKEHMPTIIASLQDPDISIRRRALDLLFCFCDQQMAG